jgi:hypothetical protein
MTLVKNKIKNALIVFAMGIAINACQKMDRPELGDFPQDPPPPPYSTLKNFFEFEDNAGDSGQFRMATDVVNITYVDGIKGKAAQIGEEGYIVQKLVNDSIKMPGSMTIAFWMNGVGPVTEGAQGLFSISNTGEFWGNVDLFLENLDEDQAFLKVHMFTYEGDTKKEAWNEVKIPGALNKWTHIAITYDAGSSQLNIYADGQPVHNAVLGDGSFGDLVFKDVNGMVIGTYQFQTDPPLSGGKQDWAKSFNGALDQFRFYNVALSADEVMALFNGEQ